MRVIETRKTGSRSALAGSTAKTYSYLSRAGLMCLNVNQLCTVTVCFQRGSRANQYRVLRARGTYALNSVSKHGSHIHILGCGAAKIASKEK
jgi:hypothetical protein